MSGSNTNSMSLKEVMEAVKAIPKSQDYVWDGIDEDDRPLTEEELRAGIEYTNARRGRPVGTDKTQISLRVDNAVLEGYKALGKG